MKRLAALLVLAHLVQCRPVDLSEGWSVSQDQPVGVIAKIVCQCGPETNVRPASYVLETQDIRQTCSEGDRLCEPACSSGTLPQR